MALAQGRANIQKPESETSNHMAKLKEFNTGSEYAEKKIDDIQIIKAEITELDKRQLKSSASLNGISSQTLVGKILRSYLRKGSV